MKTYVILMGSLADQTKAGEYQQASAKIMAAHGAILPPDLYRTVSTIDGEDIPGFVIRMEFPNPEQAKSAFASPEYLELVPVREKAFRSIRMFITQSSN